MGENLLLVELQIELLADLAAQWNCRGALQVVAGMDGQPAATLARQRLLDLLKARRARCPRRAGQQHHEQRERKAHQGETPSSAADAAYAGSRALRGAG